MQIYIKQMRNPIHKNVYMYIYKNKMCVYIYMHADIHKTNEKPYRQKRINVYIYKINVCI